MQPKAMSDFHPFFQSLTGYAPHPWQASLGADPVCRDRLLRIPTGFGKTAGAILPWLHHRVRLDNPQWPTRLVLCLPMRVLVEQSARIIDAWCQNVAPSINTHVLMGGAQDVRWELNPEKPTILVGTQDMLLSRALNRGYAIGRARWPLDFGLLHQDTLWILDEVQLMDTSLPTSAQLSAFRSQDAKRNNGSLRPCFSWWMSATLQPDWLKTIDHVDAARKLDEETIRIPASMRHGGLWDVSKRIERQDKTTKPADVATLVRDKHQHGKTTLVVINRVERAVDVFRTLDESRYEGKGQKRKIRADAADIDIRLVHSRFRSHERASWSEFLQRNPENIPAGGRIIVATQVVEAGVDISAATLVTDLCPWSSLVQRIGRCARYAGEFGTVIVVGDSSDAAPYESADLEAANDALTLLLREENPDVSPKSLEAFEERLAEQSPDVLRRLYAMAKGHVLRRRDIDDLFDTTPDLTGTDLDVSRYIRSGDERDARVFWRDLPQGSKFDKNTVPPVRREELCPVPIVALRAFLKEPTKTAFVLDYVTGEWRKADPLRIVPSMNVLLPRDAGGYDSLIGWHPKSTQPVPVVPVDAQELDAAAKLALASESEGDDRLSEAAWKTIATHGRETGELAREMGASLHLPERLLHVLHLAGRWHDAGKAHETFQLAMTSDARANAPAIAKRGDLAKAPAHAWRRPAYPNRPGFRHELASTLGLLELLRQAAPNHEALLGPHLELFELLGTSPEVVMANLDDRHPLAQEIAALSATEFNLLLWLVCTHHGKVRCRWTSTPHDQDAGHGGIFGIVDGDVLPSFPLSTENGTAEPLPELRLSLAASAMGISTQYGAGWGERVAALLDEFGPFVLAYLEAILRAADARASQLTTEDSLG